MLPPFAIMSTRSLLDYAKSVCGVLKKALASDCCGDFDYTDSLSVDKFADGEMEVSLRKSVRGREVYLFTCAAGNREKLNIDESKIELYHTVDVLRRSQASKIAIFEPYVSAGRSDRTTRRNSVGFWIHYKILLSLGMNHLITYQLHSDKSKTVFDPAQCAIDDIPATSLIKRFLCDEFIGSIQYLREQVQPNWLFCSVDAGGEKLARGFAQAFGTQLIVAHKQRNYAKANTIDSINILSAVPLQDKIIWIVDDMIDTGTSVYELIKKLGNSGAKEINLAVVHPVLSFPAADRLCELRALGLLKRIVVCDTLPCAHVKKRIPDMHIVGSERLSARIVSTILRNEQMSDVTTPFDPEKYLASPRLFDFQPSIDNG